MGTGHAVNTDEHSDGDEDMKKLLVVLMMLVAVLSHADPVGQSGQIQYTVDAPQTTFQFVFKIMALPC